VTDPPENTDSTVTAPDGTQVAELSHTFEVRGQDFLTMPVDPSAISSLSAGGKVDVVSEWAGPKDSGVEEYKLNTSQAS
jgi:hypothetical protein